MSNSENNDSCNSGDDDEDLMDLLFLYHVTDAILPDEHDRRRQRKHKWIHKRLNWAEHVRKLLHHKQAFDRTYPMSFEAFSTLLDLLRVNAESNSEKAMSHRMPLSVQNT